MQTLTRPLPVSQFDRTEAVAILTRARDRIASPRRWYQGEYHDSDDTYSDRAANECGVCALGAIRWAATGAPWWVGGETGRADRLGADVAALLFSRADDGAIVNFNDDYMRQHEQVIHAFNLAITKLLGDDGALDGSYPNVEWRLEGDGGSWGFYATKFSGYIDAFDLLVDTAGHVQMDGYDTAEAAYTAMVALLVPEAQF